MWFVTAVGNMKSDGTFIERPYYVAVRANMRFLRLRVVLTDSETGETKTIDCYRNAMAFLVELDKFDPVGFFSIQSSEPRYGFLPYDVTSLEFAKAVDRVEVMDMDLSDTKLFTLIHAKREFGCVDSKMFVFDSEDCLCTLYYAVCSVLSCFIDDEFYLFGGRLEDSKGMEVFRAYKVTFKDLKIARRMITKASLLDFNPLPEFIA